MNNTTNNNNNTHQSRDRQGASSGAEPKSITTPPADRAIKRPPKQRTRPGYIHLGKAGPKLITLLVTAVIFDNDQQAKQLLQNCWPEENWDQQLYEFRAEAWREGWTQPKALLPSVPSVPSV